VRAQESGDVFLPNSGTDSKDSKQNSILCRCMRSGCMGLVEMKQTEYGECRLCNQRVCAKCLEIVTETHYPCAPEAVANATAIQFGSRLCPLCYLRIYRQVGCNLMFCTQCGADFDWETGHIYQNSPGHNPHREEYRTGVMEGRIKPKTNEDLPCIDGMTTQDNQLFEDLASRRTMIVAMLPRARIWTAKENQQISRRYVDFIDSNLFLNAETRKEIQSLSIVHEFEAK